MYEVDFTRIVNIRAKNKSGFKRQARGPPHLHAVSFGAARDGPAAVAGSASLEGENVRSTAASTSVSRSPSIWGLIVPVLKNARNLDFLGLQRGITDLGERARDEELQP